MRLLAIEELLAESTEGRDLINHFAPEVSLPPRSEAKRIWRVLTVELLPSMAAARAQETHPRFREFRAAETLMLAVQTSDFSLQDYLEPILERWRAHMARIDAYVKFRRELQNRVVPEKSAMQSTADRLELVSLRLEEAQRRLRTLQDLVDQETAVKRTSLECESESTEQAVAERSSQLESLKSEIASTTTKETELQTIIDRLRSQYSEAVDQTLALRAAIGRRNPLRDDVHSISQQIAELETQQRSLHETIDRASAISRVFTQIKQDLTELLELRRRFTQIQTERRIFEATTVSRARQRRDQAVSEAVTVQQRENQQRHVLEKLEADVKQLRARLQALNEEQLREHATSTPTSSATSADPTTTPTTEPSELVGPDDSDVDQARAREKELRERTNQLELSVRAQKRWLDGMASLEREGKQLAEEMQVVRQWMKNYLEGI